MQRRLRENRSDWQIPTQNKGNGEKAIREITDDVSHAIKAADDAGISKVQTNLFVFLETLNSKSALRNIAL